MFHIFKIFLRLIVTKWRRWRSELSIPPQSHDVPQLWYEDKDGKKFYPDWKYEGGCVPEGEGFIYQHVEFPLETTHRIIESRDGKTDEIFCGNHKMSRPTSEVVLAMCANGYTLDNAILIVSHACERCLNVLYWEHGFRGGYRHKSVDWHKAGTSCQYCEHAGEVEPELKGFPHDTPLRA